MADELLELTVAEAIGKIDSGDISSDEYWRAYRGAADGDELNAFLCNAAEESPIDEGAADLGLRGAPIAVKYIFCTEGVETTAGSKILEGHVPMYDATAVTRLREAGARVLGKTNMDEFAMGSSNENSAYGDVCNPWDIERVP
ncbi:MAG: Asp-tRNA(Asn)/Glu-tRNA(Gln) amidotransferase GatCAB subunit A, partial [Solirubrobacterales bacterium]|nr:Asp-tRNA(Asn)/Glu-tRNA(Gln) amidotransferase GatCAB subunit A [Solirubrobacterales bacterium]